MQLVKAGVFPAPSVCRGNKASILRRIDATFVSAKSPTELWHQRQSRDVLLQAVLGTGKPCTRQKPRSRSQPKDDRFPDILDGLRGLGMVTATTAQVAEAMKELFPPGNGGRSIPAKSSGPSSSHLRAKEFRRKCRR